MFEAIIGALGALAALATIFVGLRALIRWLRGRLRDRSDESQDGPVKFLVNKGLPAQLPLQGYFEFSMVNIGDRPLPVHAFTVQVRSSGCIEAAKHKRQTFLEGTVCDLIQYCGDGIQTVDVGSSLSYRLSIAEVMNQLDAPGDDLETGKIGFAMGCLVVGDKRERFGYPEISISYAYLRKRVRTAPT